MKNLKFVWAVDYGRRIAVRWWRYRGGARRRRCSYRVPSPSVVARHRFRRGLRSFFDRYFELCAKRDAAKLAGVAS